jgi:hypothetical protein
MMTFLELTLLGFATYRLTRLITRDELLSGFRNWFWVKRPPETSKLGYLLTCEWCMSIWVASLLQISRMIVPIPTNIVVVVLALSAIAGLLTAYEDK